MENRRKKTTADPMIVGWNGQLYLQRNGSAMCQGIWEYIKNVLNDPAPVISKSNAQIGVRRLS